jgi:hypothetical protein
MKARHRIARTEFAALDPVHHGKEAHAEAADPAIDMGGAAPDIGLGPGLRPIIFGAKFGKAVPVAQRQFGRVADALAALFRRVDEKHPAKALAREPAEGALLVAVKQQHRFTTVEQVERSRNARDPAADDQYVAAIHCSGFPCLWPNLLRE